MQAHSEQKVGLLDVDNTILNLRFNEQGQNQTRSLLNEGLINAYLAAGVKDIYLFTNMSIMTLNDELIGGIPASRAAIVKELQQRGFNVLGVITPGDIGYDKGLGRTYQDMYVPLQQELAKKERFGSAEDLRQIREANQRYEDAKNQKLIQNDPEMDALATAYSKKIGESSKDKQDRFNLKGFLVDYFIRKKPEQYTTVVFADDERSCINTVGYVVNHYKEKNDPVYQGLQLITVKVDDTKDFVKENKKIIKQNYLDEICNQSVTIRDEIALKVNKLAQSVYEAAKSYNHLSHKKVVGTLFANHKNEFAQLVKQVEQIQLADLPANVKFEKIVDLLEDNYDRMDRKKTERGFGRSDRKMDEVIAKINSQPNDHHFMRMLGLILQDTYKNNPTMQNACASVLTIKIPENNVDYANILNPSIITKPEQKESLEVKRNSRIELP